MKTLLFLLLLPFCCFAQKKDTAFIKNLKDYKEGKINVLVSPSGRKSVVTLGDDKDWLSRDNGIAVNTSPQQDTIPVIMLVCDTAVVRFLYNSCNYQYGYEVTEGLRIWKVHQDGSRTPLFKIMEYLGENK